MAIDEQKIREAIALLTQALGEQSSEPVPTTPTPGPIQPAVEPIVSVTFENLGEAQADIPFTFGQVFAVGHMKVGTELHGRLDNGAEIPLQVDMKATHADGSVRHAIISGVLPTLFAKEIRAMGLVATKTETPSKKVGFSIPRVKVTANLAGGEYFADPSSLMKMSKNSKWLQGDLVDETHISLPLQDKLRNEHPHLHARFAIRAYAVGKTRVDISVENDWAYEPNPQNFTYDLKVEIDGKERYQKKALTHYHHARARLVYWASDEPQVHIKHDAKYLIDTMALPNYDLSVEPSEKALEAFKKEWATDKSQLMNVGMAAPAMPNTGGRDDIGLLPGWAALYLISQDWRAKLVTLGTADLAGSWSSHYRDKETGLPISVLDYPYMTILGNASDTLNPMTKKREAFPTLGADSKTPFKHDSSHQPAFGYLPYLVTGDYYYLEELQFWAMWDVYMSNPVWRRTSQGLLGDDQVRGQAWSIRTLGEAAYISPDAHPLKSHLSSVLESNFKWYIEKYANNPSANKLGALDMKSALVYKNGTALAPWQDDFFTSSIGHLYELGFEKAANILEYKIQFPIGRMIADGVCWMLGANYTYDVKEAANLPIFSSFKDAYTKTIGSVRAAMPCGSKELAIAVNQAVNDMGGFSSSATGYPSNMQPALAYAADHGGADGKKAWKLFMNRSVKPDYSASPQFAIVPRQ